MEVGLVVAGSFAWCLLCSMVGTELDEVNHVEG